MSDSPLIFKTNYPNKEKLKISSKVVVIWPIRVNVVQVCDARDYDNSDAAGKIK